MADPRASTSTPAWRTVDVIVAAVIAVAFGVVFWAWNALWAAPAPDLDVARRGASRCGERGGRVGARHDRVLPGPRRRGMGRVRPVLPRVGRGHRGDRLVLPDALARADRRPRPVPLGTDAEPDLIGRAVGG